MKDYQFEVCANSVESCIAAQAGGADRVELCAGIPEGGTTPSYGDILIAREVLQQTKLHIIVRPRGGDFLYSSTEQRIMLKDIENARRLGADGVVFGCLTAEGDVDIPLMEQLMKASQGMSVTFHRAFDVCRNPQKAIEDIIALGCNRILTSGQQSTAEQGIPLLKELQQQASGRIILLAGCGVNEANIAPAASWNQQIHIILHFHKRIGGFPICALDQTECPFWNIHPAKCLLHGRNNRNVRMDGITSTL